MNEILSLGIVVFALSSLYFTIKPKQGFNSAFIVSFVTLMSYLVMLQGNFANGDTHWTRWLVYGISCPLLCFEISKKLNLDLAKTIFNIFITFVTMVAGALASASVGGFRIAFFTISSLAFANLLSNFYITKEKALKSLTPYIVFGWLVFPIVFMFSKEGLFDIIPMQIATLVYLALDIFTKIIFYIQHQKNTQKQL